ncbi:MAG TPA: ATP-binding protein, partial [Dokdonella sp.]
ELVETRGDEPPPDSRDDRRGASERRPSHDSPRHGPPDPGPRLALLDADGMLVAGSPEVPADAHAVPVELDGTRIGTLRLARMPEISRAVDLGFARAQLRTAVVAAAAVLVGALVLAFAFARRLLAPVRALAEATRALAAGDYARRVAVDRRDEFGELAADFNHLAAALEQHREARRHWGADIAHELRTPLAILRGEVQALQDGVRAAGAQAFDSLHAECERLGALIEDLYQLSLADAGALDYRFEAVDLELLVRDVVDPQRDALADVGLALEETFARTPRVRADARRIAQLVDNLLANARRYTQAPGRIRVALAPDGDDAALVVEDSAPGVPAEALPRLFDRLYRVDASRVRATGGAGLGLAICRAIVEAHDGRIEATPSALGGLRVAVHLPLAARPA